LGCVLFENETYHRISSLASEAFAEPLHGRMWGFISARIDKNLLADPIVLMERFGDDPAMRELGGIGYLADLVDRAPAAANAYSYAETIRDCHARRNLIAIAGEMLERAKADHETPASDQIVEAEAELYQLAETGSQSTQGFIDFDQALQSAMDMAAAAYSRGGQLVGLSTGLIDLDQKLGGLHPSDLLIIAGRPSQGKTALATNIAFHAARDGRAVGFFSLEMSADQLALRIVSDLSGIPGDRIRKGQIDAREFGLMTDASREVAQAPLYIDATGGISIAHLTARARRAKRLHGLSLIVVDYLQLITTKGKREGNRTQEVSEITAALKALAKELNLPIIALSQLSRAVEQREDKRPQLADLRESGSIEQDADCVMFVYREAYYLGRAEPKPGTDKHLTWQNDMDEARGKAELIIGKQRHGPIGTVHLSFNEDTTKFGNLAREGRYEFGAARSPYRDDV